VGEQERIDDETLRARIRVHLSESLAALSQLITVHERVARVHGAQLTGEQRATAIWEIAGHALALAKAYSYLLHGGYVPAAGVQARALQEALVAHAAAADPANGGFRERYFADQALKAEGSRRSIQKTQKRAQAAGAPKLEDLRTLANELYGGLSAYAHVRRRVVREAVSEPLIRFAYGPHPDPWRIGSHVAYATYLMVQLAMEVAESLSGLPGFEDTYSVLGEPLAARLEATAEAQPLGAGDDD
jgi:hypothetical protein